jgi:hypothetical protein
MVQFAVRQLEEDVAKLRQRARKNARPHSLPAATRDSAAPRMSVHIRVSSENGVIPSAASSA